jgi:hypothetical protein
MALRCTTPRFEAALGLEPSAAPCPGCHELVFAPGWWCDDCQLAAFAHALHCDDEENGDAEPEDYA